MKAVAVAGVTLGLFALAGCNPAEKAEVRQQVQGVRQQVDTAAEGARQAAADAALEAKLKTVLTSRKGLDARAIDVEANGSAVVLKGDVASPEQAELAERIALETEGVESVDNQLTMRVPAKMNAPAVREESTGSTTGNAPASSPPGP